MEIVRYSPGRLPEVLELINQGIEGRRAAAMVRTAEFRQRVLENPAFDASGLLIAVNDAGQAVGLAHAIAPPVGFPHYARLAGTGFLMGPFVSGGSRGRGIGHGLLQAAEEYLRDKCERVQVHGLRTPFYHAQEGPRQPFCGSSEMMGLCADDLHFLEWLALAGYTRVEEREVSMIGLLAPREVNEAPNGLESLRITEGEQWEGTVAWRPPNESGYGYEKFGPCRYDTIALAQAGTIVGHCQWYAMRKPGRAALFDLRVDPSLRGQGLGSWLFQSGLAAMKEQGFVEVELHTSPQRNQAAYAMYRANDLIEVQNWVVLEKRWG